MCHIRGISARAVKHTTSTQSESAIKSCFHESLIVPLMPVWHAIHQFGWKETSFVTPAVSQ